MEIPASLKAKPLPSMSTPGYEHLHRILAEAFQQSATGKGRQRHATEHATGQVKPWHEQSIVQTTMAHGLGFATGQAEKKLREAQRMEKEAAIREILGAIVYAAAAVYVLEQK